MPNREQSVAIVGAGIGGLACARKLSNSDFRVQVFEKGRGVGGRISVRRTASGGEFDHGAQYFTVREEAMAKQVDEWLAAGVIAPWEGVVVSLRENSTVEITSKKTTRYVGVPGMNAIGKQLAVDLDIRLQTRVASIDRVDKRWRLMAEDATSLGEFATVVLNAPASQSVDLIHRYPSFAEMIRPAKIAPCWAAMISFDERLDCDWDAAFVENSPLSWVARNSSKPQRARLPDCWVLHANSDWSAAHLEESPDWAMGELLNNFWRSTRLPPQQPKFATAHRWRFALPVEPLEQRHLFDRELSLGACGDWCGGPRVEGAFLSGVSLADAIEQTHQRTSRTIQPNRIVD